ncbi:HlyD family efflux transporter periplasmic adaptor subunit [Allofournierella massiliensis]|uniref:HlyD family efflux transporter periplasmic adaptor subunit n=1 Tax=Allofournierella massiliensis TaxID=1650663 RepID=UPI003561A7AA
MRSSKQKIITAIVLAILVVPAVYLGVQLFAILNRPYRTETAVEYVMSDSVFADGYVVFDQTPVEGSGDLGYLVENGERVASGTAVAEVYTSTEQAQSRRQLEEIETQLSLLEKSENTSGTDVDMLYKQQQNALYDLLDCIDMQAYDQVGEAGNQYLLAANKIQIMTGAVSNFAQAKQELQTLKDQVQAQLGQPATISAPVGGYFVAADSADILSLTREGLDAMDATTLAQSIQNGDGVQPLEGAGKIVTSYAWYFYGTCSLEEGKKFQNASSVEISFPGVAEKTLPATVESIELDEEQGLAKFVLHCEYIGADVLGLSLEEAKIDFESYEGLRVDADALHIVDGEKGVYVKYGNLARWRKIQIVYQNEEYLLVAEDGKVGTDNELRMFDEVIVEGTDLKDGKILS